MPESAFKSQVQADRAGEVAPADRVIARLDLAITIALSVYAALLVAPDWNALRALQMLAVTIAFLAWAWRVMRLRQLARRGLVWPRSSKRSRVLCMLMLVFLGTALLAVLRRCLLPELGGPTDFEMPGSTAELRARLGRGLREFRPLLRMGIVFLAGHAVLRRERRWRAVLLSAGAGLLLTSMVGLVGHYLVQGRWHEEYTLLHKNNGLAGVCLASTFLLLGGSTLALRGWPRWLCAGAAILGLFQIPLTGSRTALAGIAAALVLGMPAVLLLRPREARPRRVSLWAGGAAMLVLVFAGAIVLLARTSVVHRGHLTRTNSITERLFIWDTTLGMIRENPWTGYGLDKKRYRLIFARYTEAPWRPSLVKRFPGRLLFGEIFDRPYEWNWEPYAHALARFYEAGSDANYARYRPASHGGERGTSLWNNCAHAHNAYLMVWLQMGLPGILAFAALWGYGLAACLITLARERQTARRTVLAGTILCLLAVAAMRFVDPSLSRTVLRVTALAWSLAAGVLARAAGRGDNSGEAQRLVEPGATTGSNGDGVDLKDVRR